MMTIAELDAQTAEALPARETMKRRRGGTNFLSNNQLAIVNQTSVSVAIAGRDAYSLASNFASVSN